MYERFTDRARKVMQLANQEAQRFNNQYIDSWHVLIGLVKEGSGVAANVLTSMGVNLREIRLTVERVIQPPTERDDVVLGKLPHTPDTKAVVEFACDEARGLGHNYVGTEHVLLGLLRTDGPARRVLDEFKLNPETVRAEVVKLLGTGSKDKPVETRVSVNMRPVPVTYPPRPTPYYVRLECGQMIQEVGFATHAELMAYIASLEKPA